MHKINLATVVLVGNALAVGPWALLAPRSFYDTFPGGGRRWISSDGPYNEPLVRDLGSLSLALLVLSVAALIAGTPQLFRITGLAWLTYSLPHLGYHAHHTSVLAPFDQKLSLIALSATVGAAAALLLPTRCPAPIQDTTRHNRKITK